MADGNVSLPYSSFLGYKKGEDGLPEIVPEEAEIVRFIYKSYIEGQPTYTIAKALTERKIPTPTGKEKWHQSTIKSILTNEKYKGSALLQKKFTTDFLTKKVKVNEGEVPQYWIEKSHDAIISPEEFEQVQLEMARRKQLGKQYSGNSLFAAKLVCADCGCFFGSKVWHSTSKYRRVIWQCNNKFKGQQLCSTPHLYEDEIKQRFVNAFSIYFHSKDLIIDTCQELIDTISDTSAIDKKIEKLTQELLVIENTNRAMVLEFALSTKRPKDYDERHEAMTKEYTDKFSKLQKLEQKRTDQLNRAEILQNMVHRLSETTDMIDAFDDSLWRTLIEKVTVFHDNKMIFRFLDGTEIEA